MAKQSPWHQMDVQPRLSMNELRGTDVPEDPGAYALYRDGSRIYVGKADCLHNRIWKRHSGRGRVMTGSAMRRNIAEHLGIATANDIYRRRYQPTAAGVATVRHWVNGCDIAWLTCSTKPRRKRWRPR